jgi:hypothetical protein
MPSQKEHLQKLTVQRDALLDELADLGFVLQGTLSERMLPCGKVACRCTTDPAARHGPYLQWTLKRRGKTVGVYLSVDQAAICREWIGNNRRLEAIVRKLRALSVRAARLQKIPKL